MTVYILKHSEPGFNGIAGGVDFSNGTGSTSSLRDARELQGRGCLIFDLEGHPVEVEQSKHALANVDVFTARVIEVGPKAIKAGEKDDGGADAKAEAPPAVSVVIPAAPVKKRIKRRG